MHFAAKREVDGEGTIVFRRCSVSAGLLPGFRILEHRHRRLHDVAALRQHHHTHRLDASRGRHLSPHHHERVHGAAACGPPEHHIRGRVRRVADPGHRLFAELGRAQAPVLYRVGGPHGAAVWRHAGPRARGLRPQHADLVPGRGARRPADGGPDLGRHAGARHAGPYSRVRARRLDRAALERLFVVYTDRLLRLLSGGQHRVDLVRVHEMAQVEVKHRLSNVENVMDM